MSNAWYPKNREKLKRALELFLTSSNRSHRKEINGLIVPHAGYIYSGAIAGKAYSLLKENMNNKAIILSPSHYLPLKGVKTHNQLIWQTPLGNVSITKADFRKGDIKEEHAIDNQIPFLQKLGFKEILPLIVGEIDIEEAKNIALYLSEFEGIFIISTDLSHFLNYEEANKKDKQTIEAIENLDSNKLMTIKNPACGIFPLLIFIELAKIKDWKPRLVEYKNSGYITGDKESVVGYCSMVF